MKQHNTHLLSEQSNEDHGYEYDNFGNVIADSLDDLIYDKFVDNMVSLSTDVLMRISEIEYKPNNVDSKRFDFL